MLDCSEKQPYSGLFKRLASSGCTTLKNAAFSEIDAKISLFSIMAPKLVTYKFPPIVKQPIYLKK
jgi:hypothetical protein